MNKIYATLILLLFIKPLHGQNFAWVKAAGSGSSDNGISITTDANNNVFTTGFFKDTVDFDPGTGIFNLISNGDIKTFILKLDGNGNFIWAKQFGVTGSDIGASIKTDADGNLYTAGYFDGTVDFDPGIATFYLTAANQESGFIVKLDSMGNFVWANQITGTNLVFCESLCIDISGNVVVTGSFTDTADFDPGIAVFNLITNGNQNIFIEKLDPSGNFLWARQMEGLNIASSSSGWSIATDSMGNILTTGAFSGNVDFDPGSGIFNLTSNGSLDICVNKLDSNGNFQWAKGMGGNLDDNGLSIITDGTNVYTTGRFQDTVDFDPGTGTTIFVSHGSHDAFIQKLDGSGNLLWVKQLGGSGLDDGTEITIDHAGNLFCTGEFQDTLDFDPGSGTFNLTSFGAIDAYIEKLDASGNFIWAKQMGGIGYDGGASIITDVSGNIYTTGAFHDTADFDPGSAVYNVISNGDYDVFIHKLNAITNINEYISTKLISVTPNPFTSFISIRFQNRLLHATYSILNILNQKVFLKQENNVSNGLTKTIDLSFLSKGIYLLDVNIDGERTVKKIVKE